MNFDGVIGRAYNNTLDVQMTPVSPLVDQETLKRQNVVGGVAFNKMVGRPGPMKKQEQNIYVDSINK